MMTCTEFLRFFSGHDSCCSVLYWVFRGRHRFSDTPSLLLCDGGLTVLLVLVAFGGVIDVEVFKHYPFLVGFASTLRFVEQPSFVFVHSFVFNIKSNGI